MTMEQQKQFYKMPESFKPELLKIMTLKEMLQVIHLFGMEQIAERIGYDEFVEYIKRTNGVTNGSVNTGTAANS
jgi:hypothetical protein